MKRTVLALISLSLALVVTLFVAASWGVVQAGQPVKDARPTPTPDRPISPSEVVADPDIPPLPDLVVEAIEVEPSSPRIGQQVTIKVTIANRGSRDVAPGNNFWADFYIDPAIVPIQLGQDGVAAWPCQSWYVPLDGSYILFTDTIKFDDVKTYALYAQVDTDGHVTEENENNNVYGPFQVQVRSAKQIVHQTHEDFQMGVASGLDMSHPDGVIRRGIFVEPHEEPFDEIDVYFPDSQIDNPPAPAGPTYVNQVKPALTSDGNGILYAVWEDGRHGGVYNRRIYSAYSTDGGDTWSNDVAVAPDGSTYNQVSADLAFDPSRGSDGRLYAVWQDGRNGNYDIYFAYSNILPGGAIGAWQGHTRLNDDVGSAHQLNPAIVVGPSRNPANPDRVYVVWQDQRNGNDDIYLVRSDDGGDTSPWPNPNYFVTDDPHMTSQNQLAPAIGVEELGIVVVGWEDWRDSVHPEIYAMWSWDEGQTFGIDVPITVVPPQQRTTYRLAPDLVTHTTTETVEYWDEVDEITKTEVTMVTVIHVAWQEGQGDNADVYWTFAQYDHDPESRKPCPWPYDGDFCFENPRKISGAVIDSDYVRPPDSGSPWPIEPTWQGQVTLDLVPDFLYLTGCVPESTIVYSKGVVIAWSDSRSFDDWRYEIRTRRVASPEGDPKSYTVCSDWAMGMVNGNPKLHEYRDDLDASPYVLNDEYNALKPAAVGQLNPSVRVDPMGVFVAWDDDRWDAPFEPGTVRNRDVFSAKMGMNEDGIYISPVLDGGASDPKWFVLSWWGATQHSGDLLMQTRFGNTAQPPLDPTQNAGTTWTRWTGNPSSGYLSCSAGTDCYYDAPGRHIVRPDGTDWFDNPDGEQYRYMQYKVIIRRTSPLWEHPRKTALSQVVIHYEGPESIYLPSIVRMP